jgi:hypothetical protein
VILPVDAGATATTSTGDVYPVVGESVPPAL